MLTISLFSGWCQTWRWPSQWCQGERWRRRGWIRRGRWRCGRGGELFGGGTPGLEISSNQEIGNYWYCTNRQIWNWPDQAGGLWVKRCNERWPGNRKVTKPRIHWSTAKDTAINPSLWRSLNVDTMIVSVGHKWLLSWWRGEWQAMNARSRCGGFFYINYFYFYFTMSAGSRCVEFPSLHGSWKLPSNQRRLTALLIPSLLREKIIRNIWYKNKTLRS